MRLFVKQEVNWSGSLSSVTFALGIANSAAELHEMVSGGLYWIGVERQDDARRLAQQILCSQPPKTRLGLIQVGNVEDNLFISAPRQPASAIDLFTLPASLPSLLHLPQDLPACFLPAPRLLLLMLPADLWLSSEEKLSPWLQQLARWSETYQTCLLVLAVGDTGRLLESRLNVMHKILNGVSRLNWEADQYRYQLTFWVNSKGLSGAQTLTWQLQDDQLAQQAKPAMREAYQLFDDHLYLAHHDILRGAPSLAENWQLFADNLSLARQASQHQAATIIFGLETNQDVTEIASQLHQLRQLGGQRLKLVVQELKPCMRYHDEQLLQACGANLVVPHNVLLTRLLTLLGSIQEQVFTRHVPDNLPGLIQAMRPLALKGQVPPLQFLQALSQLMNNSLQPANGKGILLCFEPVAPLKPQQIISLCSLRRGGDFVTVCHQQIWMFLTGCQFEFLDTTLNSLFKLPFTRLSQKLTFWYQDRDILTVCREQKNRMTSAQLESDMNKPATELLLADPQLQHPAVPRRSTARRVPTELDLRLK